MILRIKNTVNNQSLLLQHSLSPNEWYGIVQTSLSGKFHYISNPRYLGQGDLKNAALVAVACDECEVPEQAA